MNNLNKKRNVHRWTTWIQRFRTLVTSTINRTLRSLELNSGLLLVLHHPWSIALREWRMRVNFSTIAMTSRTARSSQSVESSSTVWTLSVASLFSLVHELVDTVNKKNVHRDEVRTLWFESNSQQNSWISTRVSSRTGPFGCGVDGDLRAGVAVVYRGDFTWAVLFPKELQLQGFGPNMRRVTFASVLQIVFVISGGDEPHASSEASEK